jgi:hypothetical protein
MSDTPVSFWSKPEFSALRIALRAISAFPPPALKEYLKRSRADGTTEPAAVPVVRDETSAAAPHRHSRFAPFSRHGDALPRMNKQMLSDVGLTGEPGTGWTSVVIEYRSFLTE